MKGSVKQIAWAEKIQQNVINTLTAALADMAAADAPKEIKEENIREFTKRLEAIKAAEYAGDVIDLFKDVCFYGDVQKDFPQVLAVYQSIVPHPERQRTILCE